MALTAVGLLVAQNTKPIPSPPSPGQAIQDAARSSAPTATPAARKFGNIEILNDTQGVDFGPYLQDALAVIRQNWYRLIPVTAQSKTGKLAIEFKILKSGDVEEMKLFASSGVADLDHPAWDSITESSPLKPLPQAFHKDYLAVRLRYFYNPDASDLEGSGAANLAEPTSRSSLQRAALIQATADAHPVKYPKKAIRQKEDGIVRLVARIGPDGNVESVIANDGNLLLGDAVAQAIRKWRFQPAHYDGKPVQDEIRIRVEFRLDDQSVRAVVLPTP
jgi:TonB family protein